MTTQTKIAHSFFSSFSGSTPQLPADFPPVLQSRRRSWWLATRPCFLEGAVEIRKHVQLRENERENSTTQNAHFLLAWSGTISSIFCSVALLQVHASTVIERVLHRLSVVPAPSTAPLPLRGILSFCQRTEGAGQTAMFFPLVFPWFSLEPSRSSFSSFENFHAAQTIGLNLVQACGICKWHAVLITPCPSRSLSSRCFWLQSECCYKDVQRRYQNQPRPRRVVMSRQPPHVAQPLLRPRPPMQMITLLFVLPWTRMAHAFNQPLVAVTPR